MFDDLMYMNKLKIDDKHSLNDIRKFGDIITGREGVPISKSAELKVCLVFIFRSYLIFS